MPRRPRHPASPTGPAGRQRSRPASRGGAGYRHAVWIGLVLLAVGLMLIRLEQTLGAGRSDRQASAPIRHEPAWATDKIHHFNALRDALPAEPVEVGYVSELPEEAVPDSGWYMLARYALIPHRVVVGSEPRLVILNLPRASLVDQVIRESGARVVTRPFPTLALLDTAPPEAASEAASHRVQGDAAPGQDDRS